MSLSINHTYRSHTEVKESGDTASECDISPLLVVANKLFLPNLLVLLFFQSVFLYLSHFSTFLLCVYTRTRPRMHARTHEHTSTRTHTGTRTHIRKETLCQLHKRIFCAHRPVCSAASYNWAHWTPARF